MHCFFTSHMPKEKEQILFAIQFWTLGDGNPVNRNVHAQSLPGGLFYNPNRLEGFRAG